MLRSRRLRDAAQEHGRRIDLVGRRDRSHPRPPPGAHGRLAGPDRGGRRLLASPVRRRRCDVPAAAVLGERPELSITGRGLLVPVVETSGISCSETTPCCRPPTAGRRSPAARPCRSSRPPRDLLCTSDTTRFATQAADPAHDGRRSHLDAGGGVQPAAFGLEQADATTLYAVGQALQLLKSTDGGATWSRRRWRMCPAETSARSAAPTPTTAAGDVQGNRIVKTTDGGDTFTAATPPAESAFAELASSTRGLAVGTSAAL